jgi:hypothetical protein
MTTRNVPKADQGNQSGKVDRVIMPSNPTDAEIDELVEHIKKLQGVDKSEKEASAEDESKQKK